MSGIEVDPEAVIASSLNLAGVGPDITGPGGRVKNLTALAESPLDSALNTMKAAWGRAFEILGEDVQHLSTRVNSAGVTYRVLEREVHASFTDAVAQPVAFSGPPAPGRAGGI
jgi:hypothetical protein